MFCPNCNGFITESSLIKSKVKKWEETDIEYVASCPMCSVKIGVMSWGKLYVKPELLEKAQDIARATNVPIGQKLNETLTAEKPINPNKLAQTARTDKVPEDKPYIWPPLSGNEEDPFDDGLADEFDGQSGSYEDYKWQTNAFIPSPNETMYAPDQLSGHYCPHCGQDLPNDVNLLPKRYRYRG